MQKAITWVREKNYVEADRQLWRISVEAHAQSYELQEAQALRRMAQYGTDDQQALELWGRLKNALNSSPESRGFRPRRGAGAHSCDCEQVRVMQAGKPDARASRAQTSLSSWRQTNRDRVIQECWHGAAGQC